MGFAVWALAQVLGPYFSRVNGPLIQVGSLGLLVGFGLAVYAAATLLLGIVDLRDLIRRLLRRR